MLPRSLAGRLLLAALSGMLAAAAVAALPMALWSRLTPSMIAGELANHVDSIAGGVWTRPDGSVGVRLRQRIAYSYDALPRDSAYRVLDPAGRVVAASREGPVLAAWRALSPTVRRFEMPNPEGTVVLLVESGEVVRGGRRYTVQVARSDRFVTTLNGYESQVYLRGGLVSAALAVAVFCIVVSVTVKRMVRPLERASAAAADIAPRNLAARLRIDGLPEELKPLIEAFNAALARLEAGYKVQQEFLAAAAHELKTPLALLRAEIELGGASNRELLLRDTDLMARQVHQLLHLAEVSEGRNYRFSPVRPERVAADAIDYLTRVAEGRSVRLRLLDACAGPVRADAGALFVLLKNLLENALNHSPAGATVTLALTAAGFSVADEGEGIAAAERPLLFRRFWRGAGETGQGAGLGLAICQEIAIAHGWSIRAAAREAGTGALFEVRYDGAEAPER